MKFRLNRLKALSRTFLPSVDIMQFLISIVCMKKYLLLFVFLILYCGIAISSADRGSNGRNAVEIYDKGNEYFKAKNYKAAITEFEIILENGQDLLKKDTVTIEKGSSTTIPISLNAEQKEIRITLKDSQGNKKTLHKRLQ